MQHISTEMGVLRLEISQHGEDTCKFFLVDAVTLDSGRGKHRLLRRRSLTRFSRRVSSRGKGQEFPEGLLQGTKVLGASAASPSNNRCVGRFKGLQGSVHSRVVR